MAVKKKILIAEEEGVNPGMREVLENLGYNVAGVAKTGPEAVDLAKVLCPDLILMNIALEGDMGGAPAAEQIYQLYDIPVICMISPSDEAKLNGALKKKNFAYLIKPFNARELYSNIEKALHKHSVMKKVEPEEGIESNLMLVSDAVITTDKGGNITRMNTPAESLTGWPREEIAGLDFFKTFRLDKGRISAMMDSLRNDASGKRNLLSWVDDLKLKKKSGEEIHLSLNIGYVEGNKWNPDEFFFVLIPYEIQGEDLGESRLEGYCRIVLDAVKDPVFLVDSNLKIVIYNQAFSDLCTDLGINLNNPDKFVYDILPKTIFGGKWDYQDIFGTGIVYKKERSYKRRGETRFINIETIPLFDKKAVRNIAVIVFDVTREQERDERDEKIAENFNAHNRNVEEIADLCSQLKSPVSRIKKLASDENPDNKQILRAASEISDLLFEIDMKWLRYEKIKTVFDFCGVSISEEKKRENN